MTNRRFSLTGVIVVFLCLMALCCMNAAAEQVAPSLNEGEKGTAAKVGFSTGLQMFLDDMLKKDEWKTADVMALVPQLQLFRKELADFQHIPNLEALKDKFPDDRIVQVLDLYYNYAVHKSYQTVAKDIEKINGWNNDARLVLLASVCARHLDGDNFAKQVELGRRLVELEPKNKKFRQELEWLEKQLAKNRTGHHVQGEGER